MFLQFLHAFNSLIKLCATTGTFSSVLQLVCGLVLLLDTPQNITQVMLTGSILFMAVLIKSTVAFTIGIENHNVMLMIISNWQSGAGCS